MKLQAVVDGTMYDWLSASGQLADMDEVRAEFWAADAGANRDAMTHEAEMAHNRATLRGAVAAVLARRGRPDAELDAVMAIYDRRERVWPVRELHGVQPGAG
jgi:hypothetical protein